MKNHFEKNRSAILADYFNLLRFPTVGTDPARLRDCVQCALWIRDWLKPLGFAGELVQAEGMAGAPATPCGEGRPTRAPRGCPKSAGATSFLPWTVRA